MSVYNVLGNELINVYNTNTSELEQAYDIVRNELIDGDAHNPYDASHSNRNVYAGGYIEIQPDSYTGVWGDGSDGEIVSNNDESAWGFPMSLSPSSKLKIKNEILTGNGYGISYVRFPMGFAYRGYRNLDPVTGLAKNIGQRWEGQNTELKAWFNDIASYGGGLSVEYWSHAPYWLVGGSYRTDIAENVLWAGGSYSRTTTLLSIRESDPDQYHAQIDAFTDAVVNDLEYVHQNICPVRLYTLQGEPTQKSSPSTYHTHWEKQLYTDVFEVLHPKVMSSSILAEYDGKENIVLMHLCADDSGFEIGTDFINKHRNWIWGYSHDVMRVVSGERGIGADIVKDLSWPNGSKPYWKNVFICEYEYFTIGSKPDNYRFANNVVRMIHELWYRKAKVLMPVIHICKPTGQTAHSTNTSGYCLYQVDMDTGECTTNPWSYNSWRMINDNVPIGSIIWMGGDGGLSQAGYVVMRKDDRIIVLLGNYSENTQTISISFNKLLQLHGKMYSVSTIGEDCGTKKGLTINFEIPAYTGMVWDTAYDEDE